MCRLFCTKMLTKAMAVFNVSCSYGKFHKNLNRNTTLLSLKSLVYCWSYHVSLFVCSTWCVNPHRTPTTHIRTYFSCKRSIVEINSWCDSLKVLAIQSRKGHITFVVKSMISFNLNANFTKFVCLSIKDISVGNINNTGKFDGRKW